MVWISIMTEPLRSSSLMSLETVCDKVAVIGEVKKTVSLELGENSDRFGNPTQVIFPMELK